jgi:hypothetical protein
MNGSQPRDEWPTSGIELLVEFRRDRLELLRAAPIRHSPHMNLHAPAVTEERLPGLAAGQAEVVLSILDAQGALIESFGFPLPGRRYFDGGNPKARTIRGGPRPIAPGEHDVRALRVPWFEGVSFLFFHRSEVTGTDRGLAIRRQSLLLVPVRPDETPPMRTLPFELPRPPIVPLPLAPPWNREPRPLPWADEAPPAADGHFVSADTPVSSGAPADRFDIVITGDGFRANQLGQFDQLASRLMNGLQGMEPFSAVGNLLNWHVVRVASTDSGIDRCPNPDPTGPPKQTFYQVEGCWDGSGFPGFFGTNHPERVRWAAEQVAPWEDVELVIVIANCDFWGGHGWPDWKLAIVPAHAAIVELASHECGHALARLADEYITCTYEDVTRPDPNKAHLGEVGRSVARRLGVQHPAPGPRRDTIWWRGMTHVGDLNVDGTFRAVHVFGDPVDPGDSMLPWVPVGQGGRVGAYWGCQDITSPAAIRSLIGLAPEGVKGANAVVQLQHALADLAAVGDPDYCSYYWDARGALFFRASASCRMRYPSYDFCRVCQHLIANSIRDAAGIALVPPLP